MLWGLEALSQVCLSACVLQQREATCLKGLVTSPVSAKLWFVIRGWRRLQGVRRGQRWVKHNLLWLHIQPLGLQAIGEDQGWDSLILYKQITGTCHHGKPAYLEMPTAMTTAL